MSTVRFRRPPRVPRPVVPDDDVDLQPPPELARGGMQNFWFTALPALSGLVGLVATFTTRRALASPVSAP